MRIIIFCLGILISWLSHQRHNYPSIEKIAPRNLIIMDGNNNCQHQGKQFSHWLILCISILLWNRHLWRPFCQRLKSISFKFVFDRTNHESFKHQCCFNGFYLTFTELKGRIDKKKSIWRRTNDQPQTLAKGPRYLPIKLLCKVIWSRMAVSWSWRARQCPIHLLQYYPQVSPSKSFVYLHLLNALMFRSSIRKFEEQKHPC